jgi:hypothetical protein
MLFNGQGVAQEIVFPSKGLPLTRNAAAISDPASDGTPSLPAIDVVGDTGANPAAYVASDATNLYFRMRLANTPRDPIKPSRFVLGYAWTCLIDTYSGVASYEILTEVDAVTTGIATVYLYQNITPASKPDSIDDPAETQLASYVANNANAASSATGSTFGGTTNYFIDWAVAWTDMAPAGFNKGAPFRLVCGTSTTEHQLTAGDIVDDGTLNGSFSMSASDAMFCDDTGCQYDAIFKDGFEGP